MRRRSYLAASSAIVSTGIAGCSELLDIEDGEEGPDPPEHSVNTDRLSEDEYPEIEWHEEWVSGSEYRVTADVNLGGAETVLIQTADGETITEIHRSDGTVQTVEIGGGGSDPNLVESGEMLSAVVEREFSDLPVGSYMVGQEDRPSRPFHLAGLSGNTSPDIDDGEPFDRSFEFDFEGGTYGLSLRIPESLYDYYTERVRASDRGAYVADPYQKPYLSTIVSEFGDFGARETVNRMMAFVQQLQYTSDEVSAGIRQYTTYPLETLFDEGGDCEDTAILLAALLQLVGYDSVLLAFWDEQHMALGIAGEDSLPGSYYEYRGTRYYYLETTAPGWKIGEVPPEIRGASAEIQEIRNHPTLVFAWQTMPELEDEGVEVQIVVRNEGDIEAENVHFEVEFENRAGRIVASETSSRFGIGPFGEHEETFVQSIPPDDEELRGRVGVYIDDELHDYSESEWRDPEEFLP